MLKLVDANNPRHEYKSPIERLRLALPLEVDAIMKRGLPVLPSYKIHSEPIYSRPWPSRKRAALFSVELYEYEGLDAKGDKCMRAGLRLTSDHRMNLSIEHTEFAVRVMCACDNEVVELLPGRDILVQVSREEAARIMRRNVPDGSRVYILGEQPCFNPIRPAIPRDTNKHIQPASAIFVIGPDNAYPKGRITRVSIDGEDLEDYYRRNASV